MDRREFLKNAFKIGGIAALYSLGLSLTEAKQVEADCMVMPVQSGSEPASGTVLFGDSTEYSGSTFDLQHDVWYGHPTQFTATWAESASTTTVGTLEVWGTAWDGGDFAVQIWDSSNNPVANAYGTATVSGGPAWQVVTFGTPPTITKNANYYLGWGPSPNYSMRTQTLGSGSAGCYMNSGTYESPPNYSCGSTIGYAIGIRAKK